MTKKKKEKDKMWDDGNRLFGMTILALLVLTISGCRDPNRPADLPKLYPVKITITQEGKPVDSAAINCLSKAGAKWSVGGITDANGVCEVRTLGRFSGAPEDTYDVIVLKNVKEKTGKMIESNKPGEKIPQIETFITIDPQYSKSGQLTLEVKGNGDNNPTFEVGKPVHQAVSIKAPGQK